MMSLVFLLSKEMPSLGKAELFSIAGNCSMEDKEGHVFISKHRYKPMLERLAYTNIIGRLLFSCKTQKLEDSIKSFPWSAVIRGTFRTRKIRLVKGPEKEVPSEPKLGSLIAGCLKRPKVVLKDPDHEILFMMMAEKVIVAELLWENPKTFLQRKPHLRPEMHPSSLDPKIAKACINLLPGAKTIYDPFCGSGGILIEAQQMDLKACGSDIDSKMLKRAEKNLAYYGRGHARYRLFLKAAEDLDLKYKHIVTDLPYGKNTRSLDLQKTFGSFLCRLRKALGEGVVMIPHTLKHDNAIRKAGLNLKKEFTVYLHKSLSKKILLLKSP